MTLSAHTEAISFSSDRIIRGLASSVLGQILSLIQAILLVPLFLGAWGGETYGHWLSITAAVAHLALFDLGGQSFIGNAMAHAFAQNDHQTFRQVLSHGLSFFVFLSAGVMVVVIVVTLAWPHFMDSIQDRLIIILMAGAYLLTVPGGLLASCYRATGQLVRGNMVGNVFRAVTLVCWGLALIARVPPVVFALVYFSVWLLNAMGVTYDLRRRVPAFRQISLSWRAARAGFQLLRGALVFWIISLSQTLNFQGVLLVLAAGLSNQAVALYSTHRTAIGLISYGTALLQPAVWSELSFLVARQQKARIRQLVLISVRTAVLFAGILSLLLWFTAPAIYSIWTRHRFHLDPSLLGVLIAQTVLAAGWSTTVWPLLAANCHGQLAKWAATNALLTIAGTAGALAFGFGLVGAAAASTVVDLVCGFATFPVIAARFIGVSATRIYSAMLRPFIALIPIALSFQASRYFVSAGWQRLLWFAVAGIVFSIPTLLLALGRRGLTDIYFGLRSAARGVSR